ncbi:CopG family transcriptional regulator [Sporolactobacillus shoreae]|uniref:ribbon-helix-helix domain-containing protein n=1 Tax=Sporolactobacillus shoreae TaxID=1465501 RepID=UPI001432AE6B|nr:CopG family transcriptional regulator [Sporolactobacillus shoreae]
MKRKQIYLTEELDNQLNELARSQGVPQAEVIREGLEVYLQSFDEKDKNWRDLMVEMKRSTLNGLNWSRDDVYAERSRGFSDEK